MISLMVTVLNKSIVFYARITEQRTATKATRPYMLDLEASLRSFYGSMSEFDRVDSQQTATGRSRSSSGADGKVEGVGDEMRSVQFLNGPFVNVVLHNLECIKCCFVTLPDIGRTELQLFQTLFQCLSAIPTSMHCPRLIRKIYSVIREFGFCFLFPSESPECGRSVLFRFAERFLNYPTVFKFASLLLDSPEMESKDSVWFNSDILMVNSWIRLIFERHLSGDILLGLHDDDCIIQFIDCLLTFITHFGSYWPGIVHDVLHLKNLYDVILRCTPSVTMHFASALGMKLIQNKHVTVGITTVSTISLHIHYLLTDTASPCVRSLSVGKQYPILQETIAKLTMTDRHILISFFVQCLAFLDPFTSSSSSPVSAAEHSQQSTDSPPNNILCSTILRCLCSVVYRTEIGSNLLRKEGRERMIWTEQEIATFEASLAMSSFVEFYNFTSLPLLRSNGCLMELVVSVLYKLRRYPGWMETEAETEHGVPCQLSIALSLLSLSWLPHCALNVSTRRRGDEGHLALMSAQHFESSASSTGPSIIEMLVRWVDSIVALRQHSIAMATYDRLAHIFAELSLFPDAGIKIQIGRWMNSILSHLVAHQAVQSDSVVLDIWSTTALSRITDRDDRVRKAYLRVLELCGTQLKRPGFALNFHPGHPQWVIPFMNQMLSLPVPTLTPKHLQRLLDYLGSAPGADDTDPSLQCGIALWACNWAGHPPQQYRDGYLVLRKFFEENTMYIYKVRSASCSLCLSPTDPLTVPRILIEKCRCILREFC